MEAKEKDTNVRCNYCGNDTLCAECQRVPGKENESEHICFDCYQNNKGELAPEKKDKTHICIPPEKLAQAYEKFLDDTTRRAFQDLWEGEKKKMRELSKQDLAEAAFFEGARFMYSFMQKMSAQSEEAGPVEEEAAAAEKHEGHSHEGHGHGHEHAKKEGK
jgi:hypothetical protein